MCSLLRYPAEPHFPAVIRPVAAGVRPWRPSELARSGRNAVEDPPATGRRISKPSSALGGWAADALGRVLQFCALSEAVPDHVTRLAPVHPG
jgi:hypothetical protein